MNRIVNLDRERMRRRGPTYACLDDALRDAQSRVLRLSRTCGSAALRDDLTDVALILRACRKHIADPQQERTK